MGYRDDMEAARLRIRAMERELKHALPATEVHRLERELHRTELQLEQEFQRRALAETAERELARTRHDLRWLERLGTRMRDELTWSRRQLDAARRTGARVAQREREIADLRVHLDRQTQRADTAEREIGRLELLLAIERARGSVVPFSRMGLDERREDLASRMSHEAWVELEDHELIDTLRELSVLLGEAIWAQPEGSSFDLFEVLIEYLRGLGHVLEDGDGMTWGEPQPEAMTLMLRIAPFHLVVEVRRENLRRLIIELTVDGLRHVIRV